MDIVVKSSDASYYGRSPEGMVLRARQLIARRFGDPDLSLPEIADELNISSSSLMRAFRERGSSPMRFANSVWLEHASRMLARTITHNDSRSGRALRICESCSFQPQL